MTAKKKQKKVFTFKDLPINETFDYRGDKCICIEQHDKHTIFDNKIDKKRYTMRNDKELN